MLNNIPVCVHTSAYRGWAISVECDQTYRFITSRNDLITEKSGFDSIESALNAAIAQVDRDVLWHEGYALAQDGQPLPEGANDVLAAGHYAAVEACNLIAA